MLIDSGSTHSFIDAQTAKAIGFKETFTPPIRVTAADGNYMYCTSHCQGLIWSVQGKSFQVDLGIIKFGGCDIALGNDWMMVFNTV